MNKILLILMKINILYLSVFTDYVFNCIKTKISRFTCFETVLSVWLSTYKLLPFNVKKCNPSE